MPNKEIFNVIFREKPAMMLVELKKATFKKESKDTKDEGNARDSREELYASAIAKTVDCTYSHVVKILQQMQKAGLVNFEKQGRLKLLSLTKTGQEVADKIDGIRTVL